ncbi:MAG: tetratricopeptide repeat protein [Bacillota bacterium]
MTEQASNSFLDVQTLLESSEPRMRGLGLWYVGGVFVLMMLVGALAGAQNAVAKQAVEVLSSVAMVGLIATMGVSAWFAARGVQREQQKMEAIAELLQLRRWGEAGVMLQELLSSPTRTPQTRIQALIFLAAVLARFHRFGDAIAVYDHLLDMGFEDDETVHGLKLGRAMGMLHEDRLFDADRAISELRRDQREHESAGLYLVEIYRDVKTGHPQEAIGLFREKLPALRQQLGHRVVDAYALAARAYDLLGQADQAQAAYEAATHLMPEAELQRRYAEVAALAGKYSPAVRPTEVA